VSSPPVLPCRACADGHGRLRFFRAHWRLAGILGLAASLLATGFGSAARGQFPIRQLPPRLGTGPYSSGQTAQPSWWPAGKPGSSGPLTGASTSPSLYGSASAPPGPGATQGNVQPPHPAVARIIVPEKDGVSLGSGTLVDVRGQFGLVVTNWHVVRDAAGPIRVEFPGGFQSTAEVVKTDRDWDLAALSISRPHCSPVRISAVAPRPGESLTIAGYGSGDWRMATGPCTQYLAPGVDFPHEMVELATEARQGDSGGPIFNQQGELAGVLFGSGPGYTSGSYGGRVLQFLATVVPGGRPGSDDPPPVNSLAGTAGGSPAPAADAARPSASALSAFGEPRSPLQVPPPQATALHAASPDSATAAVPSTLADAQPPTATPAPADLAANVPQSPAADALTPALQPLEPAPPRAFM